MGEELRFPETVRYQSQPYTYDGVLSDLHVAGEYNGKPVVRGTFREGTVRSYLFGHVAVRSCVGEPCTIYGVTQRELDRGEIVRVAS